MTLLGSQQTTEGSGRPARLQPLSPQAGSDVGPSAHIRDTTRLGLWELRPLSHPYSELKKHLVLGAGAMEPKLM